MQILNDNFPELTESVVKGGLQSLKNMVKNSPIGGENAVVLPEYKGSAVIGITRQTKAVHPLTILYGLYLIADIAKRSSFTVRELSRQMQIPHLFRRLSRSALRRTRSKNNARDCVPVTPTISLRRLPTETMA
jgi:hypothetical protein